MTGEKKIALVGDIINGITCSDIWSQEQMKDPGIVRSMARLEKAMDAIKGYIPDALMRELDNAICDYTGAYESAGILFGIQVADAIREVAAKPSAYVKGRE